jgi:hypothetical protein
MVTWGERIIRLVESRLLWTVLATLGVGVMTCLGVLITIWHPGGGLWRDLFPWTHYIALCAACSLYAMWVFWRGNEFDWYYAAQMAAFIFPIVFAIAGYAWATGQPPYFYFSGFLWLSGWLFLKWISTTIPDE